MRKVIKIHTINDCVDKLNSIFYNFFYTDLIMHKQGLIYEKNAYQKKTIVRLQLLLNKIRKKITKNKKEEIIGGLKNPEKIYLQQIKKEREDNKKDKKIYVPEKDTLSLVIAYQMMFCQQILELIEKNQTKKENFEKLLRINKGIIKNIHEEFRKDLYDYGYVVKKEKISKKSLNKIRK